MLLNEELVTDRTAEDVAQRTRKGFYMSGDLNRVAAYVHDVELFAGLKIRPKLDWSPQDFPTKARMERYLADLVQLREQFTVYPDTVALPESMALLDFEGANDIERMLADMQEIKELIRADWWYCGEFYCGEDLL